MDSYSSHRGVEKPKPSTTIWKYDLPTRGLVTLEMPGPVRFLAIGVQDDAPVLWAEVHPNFGLRKRLLEVRVTGGKKYLQRGEYLGTFQVSGPYVGHVFYLGEA